MSKDDRELIARHIAVEAIREAASMISPWSGSLPRRWLYADGIMGKLQEEAAGPRFRPTEFGENVKAEITDLANRLESFHSQPAGEDALTRAAKALYKAYEETTDEHVEQVWNYASHPDAEFRAIRVARRVAARERQTRLDETLQRFRSGTVTQEEADAMPERWRDIAVTQGWLWDGTYQLRPVRRAKEMTDG